MGPKFLCLTIIIFSGTISYTLIALTLSRSRNPYEPLYFDFIKERPRSIFLREPRRLLENICDEKSFDCLENKGVNNTLVTFIKTKADYFKRRELMRRTWGSINYINGFKLEVVYLMGKTNDNATIALLDEEEARYGDLLQYDGPDAYEKMPYKVLAGMEWATEKLSRDNLYSSADDDFLVDMDMLVSNIHQLVNQSKWNTQYNATNFTNPDYRYNIPIMCMFVKGADEKPTRQLGYKWYVSYREYKLDTYPPYCHGGMYVMSMPTATAIWQVSRTAPMLRLDDVWITGILRRRTNISDEQVYKMPKITTHFGTVSDEVRLSMSDHWQNMTKLLHHNCTYCTCML